MEGIRAIIGEERALQEVVQALYFSARAMPAAGFGALHVTCADESEGECSEALQSGFVQYLLPPLKFARRSPFRLATLGGRYEWGAVRLAEEHYATPATAQGFKFLAVKINSHVAYEEFHGGENRDIATVKPFRLGRWKRYGRESTSCGALRALLDGNRGAALDDLAETIDSEGHGRIAALGDPTRVDELYAPLYAAIVSARLQARKVVLDIQDFSPVSPTYFVVLPCVTINRHERDTELVCGMYVVDGRDGGREAVYTGLGDRPEDYSTTVVHKRFSVIDDQLGIERRGRDHRAMVHALLQERASVSNLKVRDERLERVRADVARNKHKQHHHARQLLRVALPVLAEVAPIPVAMLAFADGAAGIHHAFKVHKLAREMKNTDEARQILEEIEGKIDQLDGDRAEALLELLVGEYR